MDYREIKISRRVSLAVLLIDDFTDRIINDSSVEVKLENINLNPIRKSDGYRVFADINEEKVKLIIKSYIYKSKSYEINLNSSNSEARILKIRLEPSKNYPAYNTGKTICGRLLDKSNSPVENTKIKIVIGDAQENLICLNTINKGDKDIFIYNQKNKCLMGAEYAYVENKEIKGTFIIWEEISDNKIYDLREPITFRCAKGKKFYKVFNLNTEKNGEFSFLVQGDYMKDENFLIIQHKDKSVNTSIKKDKVIDIGNIKIEGE